MTEAFETNGLNTQFKIACCHPANYAFFASRTRFLKPAEYSQKNLKALSCFIWSDDMTNFCISDSGGVCFIIYIQWFFLLGNFNIMFSEWETQCFSNTIFADECLNSTALKCIIVLPDSLTVFFPVLGLKKLSMKGTEFKTKTLYPPVIF